VNTVTVKGVELVRVGIWAASTGDWRVTRTDLVSAVEAHRAGVIRTPPLRLGHRGEMRAGEPALGMATNFRVVGDTLVCDYTDVPRALAAVIGKAWPQRSVEALIDYTDANGKSWPLIIESVALLGAELPAVDSLNDVAALYDGVAAAKRITIAASAFHPDPAAAARHRAVAVAAARRRRTNRLIGA
jgi:hypothetical protein